MVDFLAGFGIIIIYLAVIIYIYNKSKNDPYHGL